jgi:hypothetical protein
VIPTPREVEVDEDGTGEVEADAWPEGPLRRGPATLDSVGRMRLSIAEPAEGLRPAQGRVTLACPTESGPRSRMGQMGDEDALGGLADLKLLSSGVLSPY